MWPLALATIVPLFNFLFWQKENDEKKTQHKILFFDKFSISENCGGILLIDFQEIA
jgi:hypothetical protein